MIQGVIGIIALFLKADSISVLGVIWGMLSLKEAAEEIDEFRKTKKFSLISGIGTLISLVLAAMLMIDPFKHFVTHVRILGIEILLYVLIRKMRRTN